MLNINIGAHTYAHTQLQREIYALYNYSYLKDSAVWATKQWEKKMKYLCEEVG